MASIEQIKASDGSGNANVATIQSSRSSGATTIIVDTVTGINPDGFIGSMGTPHTFTDPVTDETITVISEESAVDFSGHVDGDNLEIDGIAPGYTDNGSEVGDIVIIRPTTQWSDNVAAVLEVVHNDDGSLKDDSVTEDVIVDDAVTEDKIVDNAVTTTKINDDAVTAAKIADDAVKAQKMLYGVVRYRQGGTTGNNSWDTQGTSNTDVSDLDVFIQVGSIVSASAANKTVTFPVAYNQIPIVIACTNSANGTNCWPEVVLTTTTNFTFRMQNDAGSSANVEDINWIAIGQ